MCFLYLRRCYGTNYLNWELGKNINFKEFVFELSFITCEFWIHLPKSLEKLKTLVNKYHKEAYQTSNQIYLPEKIV